MDLMNVSEDEEVPVAIEATREELAIGILQCWKQLKLGKGSRYCFNE